MAEHRSFMGYRRENGRVAIRNHVIVLPVDDISNVACESVARNIQGVQALPHAYGRLQFGADLELTFRTLIGIGANPNVAAAVVIGIEPGWTKRIVEYVWDAIQSEHCYRDAGDSVCYVVSSSGEIDDAWDGTMDTNTSVSKLLLRWEELRERGESVAPEELCKDCPELLEELRCRMHVFGAVEKWVAEGGDGTSD